MVGQYCEVIQPRKTQKTRNRMRRRSFLCLSFVPWLWILDATLGDDCPRITRIFTNSCNVFQPRINTDSHGCSPASAEHDIRVHSCDSWAENSERRRDASTNRRMPYPIIPPMKYGGKSPHTNVDPSSAAPNLVFRNEVNGSGFQSCSTSSPQVARTTIAQMRKIKTGFGKAVYARKIKNST